MPGFIGFDSTEEMDAYLEEQRRAAAETYEETLEEQRELRPGDCYIRMTREGFCIFGEILNPTDNGDKIEEPWLRLCRSFSRGCPMGEVGTEYVQVMIPLSRELFEEARDHSWQVTLGVDAAVRLFFEKFTATYNRSAS